MDNNKFFQISPLGSADKQNQEISALYNTNQPIKTAPGVTPVQDNLNANFKMDWDKTPNNPIIQGFQSLFSTPAHALTFDHPEVQTKLFDADNLVKSQMGVFREAQQGLVPLGSDIDGKTLHTFNDINSNESFDLGKNRLYTTGSAIQQFGIFDNEEDSDKFAKITEMSGDPEFLGRINGLSAAGDKKAAVNEILNAFDYPGLDSLDSHDDKSRAYGVAFSAYNFVENAEKLSPAQQSLALSTMGTMSFKFKDGMSLGDKPIIKDADGKTLFSTGEALGLAGSGVDVYSMQKNWDQLDVIQKLSYGKGTSSQMAATGQRLGLLGDMSLGGASVTQTPEQLGQAGFKAVPSAGIGAITGHKDALPQGYDVIGAGEKPGQVIAVPKGLSYSASTINGTSEIRSLNAADGVKKASIGAFKTHGNWLPAPTQANTTRGTSFASGLGQSGIQKDPYLMSAMVTTSVAGNTVSKKQAITDIKKAAVEAGANVATAGVYGKAKGAIDAITGGKGTEISDKAFEINDKVNPLSPITDKAISGTFGVLAGVSGGKQEAQQGRDAVRKLGVQSGLINKDDWTVTLSDGSTADIGKDGKSDGRQFRFTDKAVDEVRDLHSYDVDYTNDLDFTSNLMTSSLVRMMSGGKGTPIDQVAGQLGNAALGKIGFGQDMTEENFNYVRDNVRGFYFKQGIQTKEDAFALSNQMFAEGRITETDQIALQQGINMTFDDDGYGNAHVLMSGRQKGLEVAADIDKSPGPNFDAIQTTKGPEILHQPLEMDTVREGAEIPESYLKFSSGTYGGNSNTDAFTKSIIKYKEGKKLNGVQAKRNRS